MTLYTIELKDGHLPEGVESVLFSGPVPNFGDEIRIDALGLRYRVLRSEHLAVAQCTGTYACRVVVIVEAA